jgi:hypothetical protein
LCDPVIAALKGGESRAPKAGSSFPKTLVSFDDLLLNNLCAQ